MPNAEVSDSFYAGCREPAFTSIGYTDIAPFIDLFNDKDLGAFMDHEKILAELVWGGFNCNGRIENYGFQVLALYVVFRIGHEEKGDAQQDKKDTCPECGLSYE